MTEFEFLPNEILLQCFGYLNGIDIYYAFDGLNNRFNDLIRNIPLHANFQHVKKEIFYKFCTTMFLYPSIRNNIVSLHLSDAKGTCGQLKAFLSMFQINEFSQLQSLTLVNIGSINMENMKSIFESLSNLRHLNINKCFFTKDIQVTIMKSTLKLLSVPMLYYDSMFINKSLPIKHLTITESCDLETLYEFFRGIPFLKYLKIENFSNINYRKFNHLDYFNDQANYLTQLIINNKSWYDFDLYEFIFKQTPNLSFIILTPKCLILSLTNDELCKYLNQLIKRIIIFARDGLSSIDSNQLIKFCEVFSNLEQLQCSVQHSNDLIFILERLSKLSHITIKYSTNFDLSMENIKQMLQKLSSQLNKHFLYEIDANSTSQNKNTQLNIWPSYDK